MSCGLLSAAKTRLASINSGLAERGKVSPPLFPSMNFLESAQQFEDDAFYTRVTASKDGTVTRNGLSGRQNRILLLVQGFEGRYAVRYGEESRAAFKRALFCELWDVVEGAEKEDVIGVVQNRCIDVVNEDLECEIYVQVQACSIDLSFPWKRTKTGIAVLVSVRPSEKLIGGKEDDGLFACVRWMSAELGSYSCLWGEDVDSKRRVGVKSILRRVMRLAKGGKGRAVDVDEELKPLLM